ncbi:MAG: hypothetical protein ASARMPRED_001860 [Alectoria sarmentosa]|nr:MAG: hypothetical protein ASARMPRED_001860 [Alectoria sarmentosa]
MSAIRPGGSFLQLPREIRDEIYSHYFSKIYRVYYDPEDPDEHILADLAILQVSKAISSEAKQYLFSNAASTATTFKYVIDSDPHNTFSTLPTKEVTDRMRNLEFQVRSYGHPIDDLDPVFDLDPICVDRFAGTEVIRDNFHITFQIGFTIYDDVLGSLMETRFSQTLKELKGFQKLTVVLEWSSFFWNDSNKKGVREMGMELEPYLGPSLIKGVHYKPAKVHLNEKNLVSELEFQPLKFQVKSLREKAARLKKEAERLEGKNVQIEAERSGL